MNPGVLLFKGMTVGFSPEDLKISVDDAGETKLEVILSTSYNVIPIWLRIANSHVNSAKAASEALKCEWDENTENQKKLLISELAPSIQVIVACSIALDALYDMLRPHAKITQEDKDIWKKNRTSRSAQITEVIRRVFEIKGDSLNEFSKSIEQIIKLRDMAVHPSSELKKACTRQDIPVGVDWKFCAYKFTIALNCFHSTLSMFIYLYENKCKEESINESFANIFMSLQEFGIVKLNAKPDVQNE